TKYEDLLSIANAYSVLTDYKLVFTKLDETSCYGAILNLCYLTGKRMAYITNGQNVPDDIEVAHPENITKALLGIGGVHN
ncbi:MAG: flagellar biosynthesis protein FlhF, partial [Clostridiales bacterium]|nr:flagellar biosynthesis protein FlhF [Clostridiales bacterium]